MSSQTAHTVASFQGLPVLVIGDIMLDAYLWGKVERISPEAPVPVVQVKRRSARLGGAANVALNLKALGAHPVVASVIGTDDAGKTLSAVFHENALDTQGLLQLSDRRTTVKTRVISGQQHVVRVDEEQDDDLAGSAEAAFMAHCLDLLKSLKPRVVVLEDYDKGVLTPAVIQAVVTACRKAGIPTAVDPKKRHFFAYAGVDLFKPNLKELREGLKVDLPVGDHEALRSATRLLRERLPHGISLITLSEHGVYANDPTNEHHIAAHERHIVDVSGAGDTVIAVAGLCLALGMPTERLAAWSNLAGGLVCEEVGVVPIDPQELQSEAERLGL